MRRLAARLLSVSPGLAVLATALLALIIVVFAINNVRREKAHLTQVLLAKGASTIRFLGAGTRTSLLHGDPGGERLAALLEQVTADDDIVFIAITDRDQTVVARAGTLPAGGLPDPSQRGWQILEAGDQRLFLVQRRFAPFGNRRGLPRRLGEMYRRHGCDQQDGDWCLLLLPEPPPSPPSDRPPPAPPPPAGDRPTPPFTIHVGLDMGGADAAIRQNYLQIGIMSLILLLAGGGGYLYLLTAQGYRASRTTLQRMEAFLGLMVSSLPDGLAATGSDGRIHTWNRKMEQLTGVAATNALGRDPNTVLPGPLARLLAAATDSEEECTIPAVAPAQEERHLLVRALSVTDGDGTTHGRVLLVRDLTEVRRMEAQLRRQEHLAALGRMAAGVAHELRNPLSSIKGFATLLTRKFPAASDEARSGKLLVAEVERLDRAVTALLEYARPLPLDRRPVDCHALAADALRLMAAEAANRKIHLELAPAAAPVMALADADRLRQVLLNLLLNSLQAMPDGGRVTVTTTATAAGVTITVDDDGPGIPADLLPRVTDPYVTTKADGTGLGLALVAKIVAEHQGSLTIDSQPGQGTTVTVTLPPAA